MSRLVWVPAFFVDSIPQVEKGIQTPMAQGRSTEIISMIQWIRTSRLSIKHSLSPSSAHEVKFDPTEVLGRS